MNQPKFSLPRFILAFLLVIIPLLSLTQSANANIRLKEGDVPFYTRIESDFAFHTEKWAVIVFYRPPACVPLDFNLSEFFDIPGAFSCGPTTTEGYAIWKNGPDIDSAPIQSNLFGLGAVPVWFVRWPELKSAIADKMLVMPDLEALPSLQKGYASFYHETLHPTSELGHPSMIEFVARGNLEDGRTFDVKATSTDADNTVTHIVFK